MRARDQQLQISTKNLIRNQLEIWWGGVKIRIWSGDRKSSIFNTILLGNCKEIGAGAGAGRSGMRAGDRKSSIFNTILFMTQCEIGAGAGAGRSRMQAGNRKSSIF